MRTDIGCSVRKQGENSVVNNANRVSRRPRSSLSPGPETKGWRATGISSWSVHHLADGRKGSGEVEGEQVLTSAKGNIQSRPDRQLATALDKQRSASTVLKDPCETAYTNHHSPSRPTGIHIRPGSRTELRPAGTFDPEAEKKERHPCYGLLGLGKGLQHGSPRAHLHVVGMLRFMSLT